MIIKDQHFSKSFTKIFSFKLGLTFFWVFALAFLGISKNLEKSVIDSNILNLVDAEAPNDDFEKVIECNPTYKKHYKHVKISWKSCPNAQVYHVYFVGENGDLVKLGTYPKGHTFCYDLSIADGEERTYVVYASCKEKPANTKKMSSEDKSKARVGAKKDKIIALNTPRLFPPKLNISAGEVDLSWSKVKDATFYTIEIFKANRSVDSNKGDISLIGIQNAEKFVSTDSTFKFRFDPNYKEVYFYRVSAENAEFISTYTPISPFSSHVSYIRNKSIAFKMKGKNDRDKLFHRGWFSTANYSINLRNKVGFMEKKSTFKPQSYWNTQKYSLENTSISFNRDKYLPRIWTIIIGIEDYDELPKLSYSVEDAEKLYSYFKSCLSINQESNQPYTQILLNKSATKKEIFSKLLDVSKRASSEDFIIFYFSGHGNKNMIYPVNSDGKNKAIHFNELERVVSNSKAKHKLIMLDACSSGLGRIKAKPVSVSNIWKRPSSTTCITSSKLDQNSLEDGRLQAGVFSYFLLKGLQGTGDSNNDGQITINELYQYVAKEVKAYTLGVQTPAIFQSKIVDFPLQNDCFQQ